MQASVLVARALLLLLAMVLAGSGLFVAMRGDAPLGASAAFVCPMHAEVTANEAGQCPICQMALVPRAAVSPHEEPSGVLLSAESAYTCPMHAKVRSEAPGRCSICDMPLERVGPRKHELAPAAVPAAARFAPGVTWLPETSPRALLSRTDDAPVLGVAARRVFVDAVTAPAWLEGEARVTAVLYRDELVGLSPGDPATFQPAAAPREHVPVTLTEEAPAAWDSATVLVRFRLDPVKAAQRGAAGEITPPLVVGQSGFVELGDRSRSLLVVPENAILRSPEGAYVLVPKASGHGAVRRQLAVGRSRKGQVAVLSGLAEGERIVVGSAFFLDVAGRSEAEPGPLAGREP